MIFGVSDWEYQIDTENKDGLERGYGDIYQSKIPICVLKIKYFSSIYDKKKCRYHLNDLESNVLAIGF